MRLEREAGLFEDDFLCPFEELDDLIGRRSGIGGDVVRIGRVELGVSFDQAVDSAALEEFYGRDAVEIDECKCGTGWIVGLFAPFDDPEGLLPFGQLSDISWLEIEGRVEDDQFIQATSAMREVRVLCRDDDPFAFSGQQGRLG